MFYVEKNIRFQAGIEFKTYGFHFISRYRVDFANKLTEIEIASTENQEMFLVQNGACPFVSFFVINDIPKFHEDVSLWAWTTLTQNENTVFFECVISQNHLQYLGGNL